MEMNKDLTDDLIAVCENEQYRFSSDMYTGLWRVVRALSTGDFDPLKVREAMTSMSKPARSRALYLVRLLFLKSNDAKVRSMLDSIFTQCKNMPRAMDPVAFFHADNNTHERSYDSAAIECGLVRGADLGKIKQILEGRLP